MYPACLMMVLQDAKSECFVTNPCTPLPTSCVDSDISTNGTKLSCTCPQGYVGDGLTESRGCGEVTAPMHACLSYLAYLAFCMHSSVLVRAIHTH